MFGMGTGVASPLGSPGSFFKRDDVTRQGLIFKICVIAPWGATWWWSRLPQSPLGELLKEVKPSTISTARLHRLPDFHVPPIKQVVSLRSYPVDPVGNLILRRASHLDAFSAYPDRT